MMSMLSKMGFVLSITTQKLLSKSFICTLYIVSMKILTGNHWVFKHLTVKFKGRLPFIFT